MSRVDNRRIAKNTLYMYLRMLVTMLVGLFTARIVFQALGIDNYGIYNIVGGIIVFFTFINSGLTTATRRYITAEIAQGNEDSQCNVFNLAIIAHILIALIILVLGETLGLWVVNNILNLPEDRLLAANIVYQLSLFTAALNVMQSPYTATITAYEKMNIYAYISIFEIFAKLCVAFGVLFLLGDKLIIYGVLVAASMILVMFIYGIYCHRNFSICRFQRPHNRRLLKDMFSYMGWNLAGQGMVVMTNQGVSVLVNMFFTVAANAAMGVSNQITRIVTQFVSSFQVAFHPQITKLYVTNDFIELNKLANRCSRISSYLVLILIIPICFQVKNFLILWLGDYPDYAVEFCIFTLIAILIDSMSAPLWMILSADKDVKKYQIVISTIYSLNFISAWIFLLIGFPPYSVMIARVVVYCIAVFARLRLVKEHILSFDINRWFIIVFLKTISVAIIPVSIGFASKFIEINNLYIELFFKSGIIFVFTCLSIILWGLDDTEKKYLLNKFSNRQ